MENSKNYFVSVYESYAKAIFRFIYLRVSDSKVAEDITAETFLKFWKMVIKGKTIDNDKALLYCIARGLLVDYYRQKSYKKEISLDGIQEDALSKDDGLLEKLDVIQRANGVYKKMQALKKEYQEILLLRFVEDLEISEIATVLQKDENNTRVLLHRALAAIRKRL